MKVSISPGNRKLGNIPSVSLPPVLTCEKNPPCHDLCYARKYYERGIFKATQQSWDNNLEFYTSDADGYFSQITDFLLHNKNLRLFRWHVSGDIVDMDYFKGMILVAKYNPSIDFLAYTRRSYALEKTMHNLNVVRSLWLEEIDNPAERASLSYPWFKVVPKDAEATCSGDCNSCAICWHLNPGQGMTVNLH